MKFKKGLILVLLCAISLCSCGGEKEETTTTERQVDFSTTTAETTEPAESGEPESEPESEAPEATDGGMVILDELEIGEGADGVIDFED